MVCKLSTSIELENFADLPTYGRLELENRIERSKIKTLAIKMASILIENVKKCTQIMDILRFLITDYSALLLLFVSVYASLLKIDEFPDSFHWFTPLVCSTGLTESMSSDMPGKRRDA